MNTNRELYLAIITLAASQESPRDLEEYLRALLVEVRTLKDRPFVSLVEFVGLLESAFGRAATPFDDTLRSFTRSSRTAVEDCLLAKLGPHEGADKAAGFADLESFLIGQIVDLRMMDEAGMLENEFRYFGINSPQGQYWYNFDPCTFIECGACGAFGGWESGDPTNRISVTDSAPVSEEPGFDHRTALERITWGKFVAFLSCGQMYE